MNDRNALVQVVYNKRFGETDYTFLAVFEDGSVAEAKTLTNGKRTWVWAENIWDEATANDQMARVK